MTQSEIKERLISLPNDWNNLLGEEFKKEYYQVLLEKVTDAYCSDTVYPPVEKVFSAFYETKLDELKVVIIGQDPYHEEGQANGLAFSVSKNIKPPRSLTNIYKELNYEFNHPIPKNYGCLNSWAKQGVLLLNSTLTVKEGEANSHSKFGWSIFTDNVIKKTDSLDKPLVYILWGGFAIKKQELIKSKNALILQSAHPSPLSASRGFFHSNIFIKCNEYLKKNNLKEIDWQIKEEL